MIFSCGDTAETAAAKHRAAEIARAQWHSYFAIWPVTVGEKGGKQMCATFQWVERRCVKEGYFQGTYDGPDWIAPRYEYRLPHG